MADRSFKSILVGARWKVAIEPRLIVAGDHMHMIVPITRHNTGDAVRVG